MLTPKLPHPFVVPPKPKPQLPGRKRMTIALGILASDGVVVAADTEELFGYSKFEQTKITAHLNIAPEGNRLALVSGSGCGPYLDAFAQVVGDGLLKDERLARNPKRVFAQALNDFYRDNVVQFNN
jgi:hypothetical protein